MTLRQSNLPEHQEFVFYLQKSDTWDGMMHSDIVEHPESVLVTITCAGMNLYKIVEMWKNYRPNVPIEYHLDDLYAEPSEEL
jgi:hypothetical protein